MSKYLFRLILLFLCPFFHGCSSAQPLDQKIKVGAEQLDVYIPIFGQKNVALLINHTSIVGDAHLLDTLLSLNVNIQKIFAPEHGFRGDKANGEKVNNERDEQTGLPIVSLYGKNKKPTPDQLSGIDIVVYDIQDVGARFYTYISAMHYMMEACAENDIEMVILDRPNPNGHYVDGPVLDSKNKSYVGMHPIPIVYGMTPGELALMILGEGWLETEKSLKLTIINNQNYQHTSVYELPILPSPNLPNFQSIQLYPSLCLFEGTIVSVGRGTGFPFQIIGVNDSTAGKFTFTPVSLPGISKYPKFENQICYGLDLRETKTDAGLNLKYLIAFYNLSKDKTSFFNSFFIKLAGTETLQQQIIDGKTEREIKSSWKTGLEKFNKTREKYLLYD